MAELTTPLPADLPEDWSSNQIVAPNGSDVGLSAQHGYNYQSGAINSAQLGVNAALGNMATVETSPTVNAYAVGDRLVYNGQLYKATAVIPQGGNIVTTGAGANVTPDALGADITTLETAGSSSIADIAAINAKIPSAASASNQLADKQFVTDNITQGTAIFRGTFATKAALLAVAWQTTDPDAPHFVSNNDYAYVEDDESQNDECWRYLYVTGTGWQPQIRINESPLTAAQLAALNSGATAAKIDSIATKQAKITQSTVTLSTSWSGSGPYTQTVTVSGATANSKIDLQATAAQLQQLIDASVAALYILNNSGTLTAYAVGGKPTSSMTLQCTVTEVTA